MKFTELEVEIICHRLEVPECIYEVLADTHDDFPCTEEGVTSVCSRLIKQLTSGDDFQIDTDLDRMIIVEAVEGSVLERQHPKAIASIRVKIGLDLPAPNKPARVIPANTESWNYNDGGRAAAGYKGDAGDCVCRAIVIATGLPYQQVYDRLAVGNSTERKTKGYGRGRYSNKGQKTAARGIRTNRKWFNDYIESLGFEWVPTMQIGSGCKVHLKARELPSGVIIASLSKHVCAVIDGVINDTYDPSRNGTRCVYGYWRKV